MIKRHQNDSAASANDTVSRRDGPDRRWRLIVASSLLIAAVAVHPAQSQSIRPDQSSAAATPASALISNVTGSQERVLSDQVGVWAVTETVWSAPGALPVVTANLIAERRLVGALLEETLRSAVDPTILRRDFLTFNRVEGRWEYMSFDTRAAVGMMTAQSYGPAREGTIELTFQPFAMPAGDASPDGQMLRMRQDIIQIGPDRVTKDQYFTLADGVGREWLAHRYNAVRSR